MKQVKRIIIFIVCAVVVFSLSACRRGEEKIVEKAIAVEETLFFGSLAEASEAYSTTVTLGSYPQSKVTDAATITDLNSAAGTPPATDDDHWTNSLIMQNETSDVSVTDVPSGPNRITRTKTVNHSVSRYFESTYNSDYTWKPFSFCVPQKQVTIEETTSSKAVKTSSTYSETINGVNTTVEETRTDNYSYSDRNNYRTYGWYCDVTYSGAKYRGIFFIKYRPYNSIGSLESKNSFQDDNDYYIYNQEEETFNVYWFKYEPLTWYVMKTESNVSTLISTKIIDAQAFLQNWDIEVDGKYYYANTTTLLVDDPILSASSKYADDYSNSSIRVWLNDDFYNVAFSASEKSKIQTTSVDNSAQSTRFEIEATQTNAYSCSNTQDKVYLIGKREYAATFLVKHTPSSGSAYYTVSDDAPIFTATAYAKALGCETWSNVGYWWSRSPDASHSGSALVAVGGIDMNSVDVKQNNLGVVPVIRAITNG